MLYISRARKEKKRSRGTKGKVTSRTEAKRREEGIPPLDEEAWLVLMLEAMDEPFDACAGMG